MTSSKTRRRVHAGTALSLAVAAAISASPAWAEPVQPGTDPGQSGPEQGGTTPSSPEQPGTTTPPAPAPPSNYNPGPGLVPSPPQGQWTPSQPETTSPPEIYSPVPVAPIHTPRATPPVKRIAPPPDHIRVGNFTMPVKDLPDLPMKNRDRDKTVVSVNEWAAYTESEITRFLISIGVPEDKASRQAAAAMIGIAAGGGIGFAAGFTATAILVGPVAIPVATGIGCGVGMSLGGLPQTTLAGCGIGLASGVGVTLAAATAVGTATGASGAVLGGILAWALGAGDKGANPKRPDLPWEQKQPGKPEVVTIVDPSANQFEVHTPPEVAQQHGLPPVDYVVTNRGDVNLQVGGVKAGWTAEQAQAPIKAIEQVVPGAERAINDGVRTAGRELQKAVPGLTVAWPQEKPQTGGKHRAK